MQGAYCLPEVYMQKGSNKGRMEMFAIPEYPLDNLSLDIVGPIPSYHGNESWVAVVVDRLSLHIWTCMFLSNPSSILLFEFIKLEIIEKFQKILLQILTDRGSQLKPTYWSNLLQKYDIQQSLSSTFYAQTDGLTEHLIQLVLTKLRILSIGKIGITIDILVTANAAMNSTVSSVTKVTPASILTKLIDY
jgi:hypothetical protein